MTGATFDIKMPETALKEITYALERSGTLEPVGVMYCGVRHGPTGVTLLYRGWELIPQTATELGPHGHGASWRAETSSEIISRARSLKAAAVLMHSHGRFPARFSKRDVSTNQSLLPVINRLTGVPAAALLLGNGGPTGALWDGPTCS